MSKEKASVSPKPSSPAFSVDPRYVGRITGILLAICLIVSLLLGVVNQITKPRIDAIQAEKIRAAMAQVLGVPAHDGLHRQSVLEMEGLSVVFPQQLQGCRAVGTGVHGNFSFTCKLWIVYAFFRRIARGRAAVFGSAPRKGVHRIIRPNG